MLNELVRWNPFEEELSSWHRDIDDLFGRFFGSPELRSTGARPQRSEADRSFSGVRSPNLRAAILSREQKKSFEIATKIAYLNGGLTGVRGWE